MSRVREYYLYRFFIWSLIQKEFKVRYTQSILGSLWMMIEPLLLVLTLTVIFTILNRHSGSDAPFPIFFYSGVLPWNLFKNALVNGSHSFIQDRALIQKINFPRELSIFKNWSIFFVEFLFGSAAFFVVMAIHQFAPNMHWFYIPLLIFLIFINSIGLMLLTASINVYIRDTGILLKAMGTVWFWFTPVIFDFPYTDATKPLYWLNPMVGIIKGFRAIIIHDQPPDLVFLIPPAISGVILLSIGFLVFKKTEKGFVDVF